MPTQWTRRASGAVRKNTTPVARSASGAASRKHPRAPVRSWNAYPGAGPIVDPDELADLRREQRDIKRELLQLKRDIAWNRVIDDAIHLCRVLCKAELAELDAKYRADQPRVPAGNPDGGQWVDDGSGGASAGVAGTAPADGSIEIDDAARVAAQAAAKLRQLLQAGGQIVTAAGAGTSAVAVGILMATADATGGARQEQTQTLADGTIVTVSSHPGDTPDRTIRAESPDGTVTYATISIGKTGNVKVLSGEVHSPGGGRQPIDPNAFAAAAGALINAATGGGGGKPKPGTPDKSGLAATPPPKGEDPDGRSQSTAQQAQPSKSYRETFFRAHPELRGRVNVHHSVEQRVLQKYPGRFNEAEIHSLQNLRGIPNGANSEVHLTKIRVLWNTFYRAHQNPTRQQILDHAKYIDNELGRQFAPTVR